MIPITGRREVPEPVGLTLVPGVGGNDVAARGGSDAAATSARRPRYARPWIAGVAAAVVALALVVVWVVAPGHKSASIAQRCAKVNCPVVTLTGAGQSVAAVMVLDNAAYIDPHGLPPTPAGDVYVLWSISQGKAPVGIAALHTVPTSGPVRAGTFTTPIADVSGIRRHRRTRRRGACHPVGAPAGAGLARLTEDVGTDQDPDSDQHDAGEFVAAPLHPRAETSPDLETGKRRPTLTTAKTSSASTSGILVTPSPKPTTRLSIDNPSAVRMQSAAALGRCADSLACVAPRSATPSDKRPKSGCNEQRAADVARRAPERSRRTVADEQAGERHPSFE